MARLRFSRLVGLGTCLVVAAPSMLRADAIDTLISGLRSSGFDVNASRNPLSGGVELGVRRDLQGNPLDFGAWDLTLSGPISFDVSTGGRLLPQFDLSFTTAIDDRSAPRPLQYNLNFDSGNQAMQVDGTLLIDGDFSVNALWFYDFSLTYSSRQEVDRGGRFANDTETFDTDVGPINVSGNLMADVLALLTQPVFQQLGTGNPFTNFSGRGSLADLLTRPADRALAELAAGNDAVSARRRGFVPAIAAQWPGRQMGRLAGAGLPNGLGSDSRGAAVPEPAVLILMLLGTPFVLRRTTRRLRVGSRQV